MQIPRGFRTLSSTNWSIMPVISLRASCFAQNPVHGKRGARAKRNPRDVGEASARAIFNKHLQAFSMRTGCQEPYGTLRLIEDAPAVHIRANTLLVASFADEYLPNADVCVHCGWFSGGGTRITAIPLETIAFYCLNEECQRAADAAIAFRTSSPRNAHIAQGLCMYQDLFESIRVVYCLRTATGEDNLCGDHRGLPCDICGQQATVGLWDNERQPRPHLRCDEHDPDSDRW